MLRVRNLTKHYPNHTAVQDVSFEVGPGETLVLLGTSGCGKTTTLKMINRLIEPTSGTIELNGVDVQQRKAPELRREIGYVIQETGLLPHYTVGQNIALVPKLLNWPAPAIRRRQRELLAMLQLPEEFINRYPDQLSGGQRQRVGLARALAADPPVVLMDEPFGALDPVTRADIRREFRQLETLRRKTIVLVTHDVQEAFELGDRICLLNAGQMQQIGTPRELLFSPANAFVRRFFAAQQLALTWTTLTLADLLPYFPVTERATLPTDAVSVELSTPLINLFCLKTDQKVVVRDAQNRFFAPTTAEILTALGHFLETQPRSGD